MATRRSGWTWIDWLLLAFIVACLVFYFGWHEFDAVTSWLREAPQ